MFALPTLEASPTFDAQSCTDSTDFNALVLGLEQTGVVSGMGVTTNTGLTVSVASGVVEVAGVFYAYAGGTATAGGASTTDRRDIVVYTVGTGVQVIAGTANPAGGAGWTRSSAILPPVKPAIPGNSVVLGELYLEGTGAVATTSFASGNITDKRVQVTPPLASSIVTLTDAATVAVNAGLGLNFRLTLGGNRTLGNPTNPTDGQTINVAVTQPMSGGPFTLGYGSVYAFYPGLPAPILSTSAGATDLLQFTYFAPLTEWLLTGALIHDMIGSTQQPAGVTPASLGLVLCTMLKGGSSSPLTMTGQLLFASLVTANETTLISTLGAKVDTAGVTPGTGVNLMAIFSAAGLQLGVTGDMTTPFESTGNAEGTLGTPVQVVAGTNYYLVSLANFTGTALKLSGAAAAVSGWGTIIFTGESSGHATMPSSLPTLTPETFDAVMWGR